MSASQTSEETVQGRAFLRQVRRVLLAADLHKKEGLAGFPREAPSEEPTA
jgi:hypothetical protein